MLRYSNIARFTCFKKTKNVLNNIKYNANLYKSFCSSQYVNQVLPVEINTNKDTIKDTIKNTIKDIKDNIKDNICEYCHGYGFIKCLSCKGYGKKYSGALYESLCNTCKGMGSIECHICGGDGESYTIFI